MTSLDEQLVNGKNLIHIEEFVKFRWGEDGVLKYKEDGKGLPCQILEEKNYPLREYVQMINSVKNTFDLKNAAFLIGKHRAKHLMLTKATKTYGLEIFNKVASAWHKFNNFGKVEVEEIASDHFIIMMSEYESDPTYCQRMEGFFDGLITAGRSGSYTIKKKTCVCDGDGSCDYVVRKL